MKPMEGTYQAATQVKVLSHETFNIIEVDTVHEVENSMKDDVMVSHHSLYRGLRPWHDKRWKLCELGRTLVFSKGYAGTSQQRQGLANDTRVVGLADSSLRLGKLATWRSGQRYCDGLRTHLTDTRRLD